MTDPASSPATLSDPAFAELREAYQSGDLVIFAGAGVSAAAGLPSWKRLVELLSERARARGVGEAALQEIAELTAARQFIDALSALKDCLGAADFCTVVERHLDDRLIDEPDVARAIAALAPRLRAVLTTNIDHLFERAFGGRWPMLPRATRDIVQRKQFILKLHGTLIDRSSWVFTREDYDRATFADPTLRDAFTAFFHAFPILFVGYGLADDDFDAHLARVRAFAGDQPPRHFALVSADSVKPHRRKKLEAAGIRLIAYENPDGKHTAVVELLRQLAQPAALHTAGVSEPTRQLAPSEAIRLIQEAGFEVSEDARDEAIKESRTREVEDAREMSFVLRVLSCGGQGEGLGIWLRPGTSGHSSTAPLLAAALTLPELGGFNLYFPEKAVASSEAGLIELARKLRAQGGTVYVYGRRMPEALLAPVLERVGLRETLAEAVGAPLRSHAQRCFSGWSAQDEQGFVAARARLYPTGEVLPVSEALDCALTSPGRALLLGDFGTGKSTHLRRRAALMAKTFLEVGTAAPAPVLLPLGGMELTLDALVARHLPGISGEALRLAIELGLALPLFDGLDEARLDPDEVGGAVDELLASFSGEQARAVLTSRKTLFPDLARLRGGQGRSASPFALLEMEELDRSEVAEFVGRRTPSEEEKARVLEGIRRTHDLTSLSKRPVLLELILKSQERLSSGELNATRLYELATEDWLDSRKGSERQVIREHRRAFARGLARALFDSGKETVTHARVMQFVMDVLGERYVGQNADEAALEVRTAVFLAHEEEGGGFHFAHKSFLEYFLAVDISERLDAGREDALDLPRLTPEVVSFLAGLERWKEHAARLRQILTRGYRGRVSENALLALYFATRDRVGGGEALGKALEAEMPEKARLAGAQLAEVELPWLSLPGADLSGADLSGARLSMADLRGARLDRARLDHAVLEGALLDRARLVEASLFSASLVDASTAGVQWGGADREGLLDLSGEGDSASLEAILHTSSGSVNVVAWSPDRRRLASGGAEGMVRVWEARSGKLLHEVKGHAGWVGTVAYAPDGASLASGGGDGTVRVWEARSGKLLHELKGHAGWARTVAYAPDGASLASGGGDGTVRVWEARSGKLLHELKGHTGGVRTVAYAPDGASLASGSDDGTVRVWEARSGKLLHELKGHAGWVRTVAYAPDGASLASGSDEGTVRVWEARGGKLLHELKGHAGGVMTVAYAPDGASLASGSDEGTVRVWEARSGKLLHELKGHALGVMTVAYAPDGASLASGGGDGTVRVWEARSGKLLHELKGHTGGVRTVAYAPDGVSLASGGADGTVRVWEARSGKLLHELKGHAGGARTVAYAPDGASLASGGDDGTVRVWEARSGKLLHELKGHTDWVMTVAYAPDGASLASGGDDGTVRVWTLRPVIRSAILAASPEGWVWLVEGTPFFLGEGDPSHLLHFTSGACAMPATLWSPLFHRPEIIREALAGKWPDLQALGLKTFTDCVWALQKERKRRGLVRRRATQRTFQALPAPSEPPPLLTLTLSQFTLGLVRGEGRPPVELSLRAARVSSGMTFAATLHVGAQQIVASRVALERSHSQDGADTLRLRFEVPGPGDGVLTLEALSVGGTLFKETFKISFVPENPFIIGTPIRNPLDFYGREEDLARILRRLETGHVAILGEMRIGKTSLLYQLERYLSGRCHLASLQRAVGRVETLPLWLAEQLTGGEKLQGDPWHALDRAISIRLEQLVRAQGPGARFHLLLDEAQILGDSAPVWNELRELFQARREDGLRVVVAGPPAQMQALRDGATGSAFLNIFYPHRLPPMSRRELALLLRTPLGDEYTVTDEAVERVEALSGGRPLIAQDLGGQAFDTCLVERRFRIEAEDIERAFREVVFANTIHFFDYPALWGRLPEEVRKLLLQLARQPTPESPRWEGEALELLKAHGFVDATNMRSEVQPPFLWWIRKERA
jgi:WD40 repeat protein